MSDQSVPEERWRSVLGYEGKYEVSDRGRVRSLWIRNKQVDRPRTEPRMLRARRHVYGYPVVTLGASTHRTVHALVLEAFVGPRPPGHEASHLNGDPSDARPENLRWETHAENMARTVGHGTSTAGDRSFARRHPERLPRGERNRSAKLTEAGVRDIHAALARGETLATIGARLGVGRSTVADVARGATWRHVRKETTPCASS